jgi:hypothetical protein
MAVGVLDDGLRVAQGGAAPSPATAAGTQPSWTAAHDSPTDALRGPLRDAATGLCVDISARKPAKGAEAVVRRCTSAATQQWAYTTGGLLRSLAAPKLCLDSRLGFLIQLVTCAEGSRRDADDLRYDFILLGEIVPRWNQKLAVVPASPTDGAGLVLKLRDDTTSQHWLTETSAASPQAESIATDLPGVPVQAAAATAPKSSGLPSPATSDPGFSISPSASESASASGTADSDCYIYSCGYGRGDGYGTDGQRGHR